MAQQTLADLADLIPNGFHDARLKTFTIDYERQEARLSLDIWIGDLDAATEEGREAYRRAEVLLSGVVYCVSEPPDSRYPYDQTGSLRIDIGRMEELTRPISATLPPVPETAFANWIFVTHWNAFIYLAARNAHFDWSALP